MISQRTVTKLDILLRRLLIRRPHVVALWTWREFRDALYASEFDAHFLDHLEQDYHENPSRFLPRIHDGTIPAFVERGDGLSQPVPKDQDRVYGQVLLFGILKVALTQAQSIPDHVDPPTPRSLSDEVITSLREDGHDFVGGKIVSVAMRAVDLEKEDDYLIALIRSIKSANMGEIQHHHDESDKAMASGVWGGASSEARNFFIATLRGLRSVSSTRGKIAAFKQPGKDGPLIEDLKTIGLLTDEEKNAVMNVWVLLSHSGPHVGIKEEDSARLSRLLAIGMTEWIVLKFIEWERNGFKPL